MDVILSGASQHLFCDNFQNTLGNSFSWHILESASPLSHLRARGLNNDAVGRTNITNAPVFWRLVLADQVSTPSKIADNIFENFIKSKKNLFSRVSSKIIDTVKKEDKIEDFTQELERTGVWMIGRREVCIWPFNLHVVLFLWYGVIDCSL